MRFKDSPKEAAWRAEIREFLERHLPDSIRTYDPDIANLLPGADGPAADDKPTILAGGKGFRPAEGDLAESREKLAERGWIEPH